ncbi:MAG: hypothetical protein M3O30_17175 [Planctomycetota bacterium]|nr:hypothetical protein [Planctomycetota bacterium]
MKANNSIHRSNSNVLATSGSVSKQAAGKASANEGIMSSGKKMGKGKSVLFAAAAAALTVLGLGSARSAQATQFTLTDRNSSVAVDPTSPNGMSNWTVDGSNQLAQEWFWYRVGPSGTASRINTLVPPGAPTVNTIDTSGSGNPNYAQVSYPSKNGFQVSLTYSLTGGKTGTHSSDLGEIIKVTNTSGSSLDYHFYQYSDFTLGNAGESVQISGGNTATVNGNNFMTSQTVVSPKPTSYQAGAFPNLVNALDNTNALSLNSAMASASATNTEWAFEWDKVLAPGASLLITVDKQVHLTVPEPTSAAALFGLGGLILARPRRRDEDPDPRTAQVAEA